MTSRSRIQSASIFFKIQGQSPCGMAMSLVLQSVLLGLIEMVPFIVRGRIVDSEGAGSFMAVKHLKINIQAWVPRKISK